MPTDYATIVANVVALWVCPILVDILTEQGARPEVKARVASASAYLIAAANIAAVVIAEPITQEALIAAAVAFMPAVMAARMLIAASHSATKRMPWRALVVNVLAPRVPIALWAERIPAELDVAIYDAP